MAAYFGFCGGCSPVTRYSTETPSAFAIFTPVSTFGNTSRASIYDKKVLLLIPVPSLQKSPLPATLDIQFLL